MKINTNNTNENGPPRQFGFPVKLLAVKSVVPLLKRSRSRDFRAMHLNVLIKLIMYQTITAECVLKAVYSG